MVACALGLAAAASSAAAQVYTVAEDGFSPVKNLMQSINSTMRLSCAHPFEQPDDASVACGGVMQIQALPAISENIDSKIEARVSDLDVERSGRTYNDVIEAWLAFHFEKADLRIGRQIVAWGRADGINPTDNLTPRDMTIWLPFEDDQRLGTAGLKLNAFLSNELTLTTWVTPYFSPTKTLQPRSVNHIDDVMPERKIANTTVAMRLNRTGGEFDWSVSAFRGFNLLPSYRIAGFNALGPQLEKRYGRLDAFGADVARNFGLYAMRAELAYMRPGPSGNVAFDEIRPSLYYVVGGDRTFDNQLNINLQVFGRHVFGFSHAGREDSSLQRNIEIQNAITHSQLDRSSYGLTMRINKKWLQETLESDAMTVINITRWNSYQRFMLSYAFNDRMKGTIGFINYNGDAQTIFGRVKRKGRMFVEVRYAF